MQGLRKSKLGYKDTGIRNSEFVAKAQFISNIFLCFKEKNVNLKVRTNVSCRSTEDNKVRRVRKNLSCMIIFMWQKVRMNNPHSSQGVVYRAANRVQHLQDKGFISVNN